MIWLKLSQYDTLKQVKVSMDEAFRGGSHEDHTQ